jgi:hypothetical protein
LTTKETAALSQELHDIVESDRYPFSPRIRTLSTCVARLMKNAILLPHRLDPLKSVLAKLEPPVPQPERKPPMTAAMAP